MNNSTIALIILVVIVAFGGYYFFAGTGSSVTPVQSPPQTTAAEPSASAPSASPTTEAAVGIQNFAFNPATLAVKTGATVTWTNRDRAAHTVTSDAGGVLNSPTLAPGQSFSHTFASPGTFSYHCAIHPMMKATVSVMD